MIGERLAELRAQHNMTQEEFAEKLDVSRQSVSKWELDKALPDVYKILRISELYQVSVDYLLKGVEAEEEGNNLTETLSKNDEAEQTIEIEKEDVEEEKESTEEIREQTPEKGKRRFGIGLKISAVLVGILLLGIISIFVFCMLNQVWNRFDNERTLVRVDSINSQYSVADVSCYTEEGTLVTKTVFLDTKGVGNGDYIYCYLDNVRGKVYVDYSVKTIAGILVAIMFLFIIWILLVRELRLHE